MPQAIAITVLYFAAVRDLAGKSEEHLELPDGVRKVKDFAAFLQAAVPALEGRLESVRYAVNEAFASDDTALEAGDVIAVIPPVSGG